MARASVASTCLPTRTILAPCQRSERSRLLRQPWAHDVREPSQFAALFTAVERRRPYGMFVIPDYFLYTQREAILDFLARNRIPAAYGLREYVLAGGLIAIGADCTVMFSRAGSCGKR